MPVTPGARRGSGSGRRPSCWSYSSERFSLEDDAALDRILNTVARGVLRRLGGVLSLGEIRNVVAAGNYKPAVLIDWYLVGLASSPYHRSGSSGNVRGMRVAAAALPAPAPAKLDIPQSTRLRSGSAIARFSSTAGFPSRLRAPPTRRGRGLAPLPKIGIMGPMSKSPRVTFKFNRIAEGDWQIEAHYPGAEIRYIKGFKTKAEIDEWLAGSLRIDWLRSQGYAK